MKRLIVLVALIMSLSNALNAQTDRRVKEFNLDSEGLALNGYDPVSYFQKGKAIKGKSSIAVVHDGVKYRFATEAHKTLFVNSPSSYEPQYGGWCAYAMGAKEQIF
jgi:hypothetical protein